MFYEELAKVSVFSCSFETNQYLNREYLKAKCVVKLRDEGYTLNESKFTQMSSTVEFYGEHEELEKLQLALLEALNSGKKAITTYADLNFSFNRSLNPLTGKYNIYAKIIVCDYKYCVNKKQYHSVYKDKPKYSYALVDRLQKENKKLLNKNVVIVEKKTKKEIGHLSKINSAQQYNRNMNIVEIEDNDIDKAMEELKTEILENTTTENIEIDQEQELIDVAEETKESKNNDIFNNLFGETKW